MIDESITFFVAGTLTLASALSNTICYLVQNKTIGDRARESLVTNFKTFKNESASLESLAKELDMDTFDQAKDDYLKYCFYESLRIDPPLPLSTSFCMNESVEIGGVQVRAGEIMNVNIH
jgi:cytochrome P450